MPPRLRILFAAQFQLRKKPLPVNKLSLASGTFTSSGPQTGVAVGTITGDYTIKFSLSAFAGANARIVIEEDVSNAFSTPKSLWVQNFNGNYFGANPLPPEGITVSFRKRDAAGTDLVGTSGAYARVNVQELNGSSPSLTFNAWLEY
jgi:hypothetical protein